MEHRRDAQGRQGDVEVQLLHENHRECRWGGRAERGRAASCGCCALRAGAERRPAVTNASGRSGAAVPPPAAPRVLTVLSVPQQLLDDYPKCFVVGADNVGSKQMQQIRMSLRGKAVVLMGKNTMMRKAIRGHLENNPALEKCVPPRASPGPALGM